MTAIRFTGWRVSAVTLVLSITALLASAMFALAQGNALFQRMNGVALELSADQQGRVIQIQNQGIHEAFEYVSVDSNVLSGSRVLMTLADESSTFSLLKRIDRGPGDYSWIGTIPGAMDQAVLVVRNGEVTGQIDRFTADGSLKRFSIAPLGGELHLLSEIDTSAYPPDHRPGPPPVTPNRTDNQRGDAARVQSAETADATASDGVVVDILVAYTPAAASANGNIQAAAQLAIDTANASYSISNANVELRLVGTIEATGYSEAGKSYDDLLYNLSGYTGSSFVTPSGVMGTIHARRNALGADLVAMLVAHQDYCGLAWITSQDYSAFSVTSQNCISNHSFSHELGHNFGALHDVANSGGSTPAYPYGYGYIHPGNLWRTIQSYGGPCGNCARIGQFSNPSKTYNGAVTGTAATHDVARLHRNRVSTVAAFRPTAEPVGVKAVMNSPAPGSTLTSASATFSWSTGTAVTEYWLDVGTGGAGATNVYNASTGTSTSRTVSGLPASGTLNVRLWSRISGSWQSNDYTYTMNAGAKAVMSSPTPGSTLTSNSATFSWTAGTAVTEYWLAVGTTGAGATNIYNKTTGTARSLAVSGLPASGTLYVRLFSRIGGAWQQNDYTYTMNAATAKAVMSSPTPGSTLTSNSATFSWTAGSGVTEYWLYVGTTGAGSANIENRTTSTARSLAVSGLPTSGTLYVRLFSRIAGVWQHNDYVYTMNAATAKAVMSSPTPGSTLTSNSATFSWTAGSGVTEYWFTAGTGGAGAGNLANTSTGMTRSRVVSGLPSSGTLNVRLWSMISGAWQYTDYTYAMAVSGGSKAVMSSPTPSSTLTSNSATFSWTAGSGVTEYWLYAGTTGVGSANVYNKTTGTARSVAVANLPASGTLYVRLFSLIGGVWQHNDYVYTMNASTAKAAMSSPTPGSNLPNSSAAFSWTAGTGVTEYWLTVGTNSPGNGSIYNATTGTARTRTVTGLPTSGTVHVRLWSMIAGAWQYNDYTYTSNRAYSMLE